MMVQPWRFFVLVLVFSVPFYLLGMAGTRLTGLTLLPASALMAVVPMIAGSTLILQRRGVRGFSTWLREMLGSSRRSNPVWYLTAVLFLPVVSILEFAVLRLSGTAVPFPQISLGEALFLFAAFFIGAVGEEVGWQGYAYPALRQRSRVLVSALVLGAVWALWHVVPFVQLGRSSDWILWHSLSAVALRIIIVWLFENSGGSMLVAVLFHTMINLSWALFPVSGSFYDPLVMFLILSIPSCLIAMFWQTSVRRSGPFLHRGSQHR
jgi:uncharacterized protein